MKRKLSYVGGAFGRNPVVLATALCFLFCGFATCDQTAQAESEASSMASSESGFGVNRRRGNRRALRRLHKQERRAAQQQKKLAKPVQEGAVWNAPASASGNGVKRRKRKNKKQKQMQSPQGQVPQIKP